MPGGRYAGAFLRRACRRLNRITTRRPGLDGGRCAGPVLPPRQAQARLRRIRGHNRRWLRHVRPRQWRLELRARRPGLWLHVQHWRSGRVRRIRVRESGRGWVRHRPRHPLPPLALADGIGRGSSGKAGRGRRGRGRGIRTHQVEPQPLAVGRGAAGNPARGGLWTVYLRLPITGSPVAGDRGRRGARARAHRRGCRRIRGVSRDLTRGFHFRGLLTGGVFLPLS